MHSWRHHLTQAWSGHGWLACALWPVSAAFGVLVRLRMALYRWGFVQAERLPVPVIVVGNVLLGGVGKTPLTMALVDHLRQRGLRVGVLSRGYGRQAQDVRAVQADSMAHEVGDEPLLIARHCRVPVWVGANRVAAGRALLAQHPEVQVLVCDDGLQHLALVRDVELCVFDERGIGNGWLLPAGPLREPWPHRPLNQATLLLVNTAAPTALGEQPVHRALAKFAQQADGTRRELQHWAHAPAQALAGIAKPEVFFDMLRAHGVHLLHTHALPDHAELTELSLDPSWGDVLCTEKDAVKLWHSHPQAWAVPLVTTLPEALLNAIDQHLDAKLSSPHGRQTT